MAETIDFSVEGMTCGSCAARVQRSLEKVPGVVQADVNLATHKARVTGEPGLDPAPLVAAVDAAGYTLERIEPAQPPPEGPGTEAEHARAWRRRVIAVTPPA
ncbi:MAG TPA: heavy metal-associated domain-containing protein, partial [Actinomycetota bacterium]|nr:heavy metal-associated domain-containing protein [Actinomycetota bacterium]